MTQEPQPTPVTTLGLAVFLRARLDEYIDEVEPFEHVGDVSLQRDIILLCEELAKNLKKVTNG